MTGREVYAKTLRRLLQQFNLAHNQEGTKDVDVRRLALRRKVVYQ